MLWVSGLLAVQLEVFLCCRTSPERGLSNGAMLALPWEQHGLDPGAGHGQPLDGMLNPHIPSGHGAKTSDPLELLWGGREEHVELQLAAGLAPMKDSGKINYSLLLLNAFSPHSDVWHT